MFDVSFAAAGFAGLLSFLSPCILPIVPFYLSYLAGISMNRLADGGVVAAAATETVAQGAWLLLVYGLGMTLPFVLAAAFIGPFMRWMARFRRHLGKIEKVMGIFLIVFGLLIATNTINFIAQWMLEIAPDIGVLR